MRRYLLLTLFALLLESTAFAQEVQWASKVLEFSSELTPVQYSAEQILGKPNVLPAGGQNPNAWTPDRPKQKEFIKLGYDHPIQVQQIAIAESYNPSGLYRVLLYDEAGTEHVARTLNPVAVPLQGRMLNVFVEKTTYKVAAVKLEFDGGALPEYFSIDAVAITDSHYPIIADIIRPELLASGIVVEKLDASVNSDVSEMNPMLSPDGKTLYFSRQNHPENVGGVNDKEDIWYSELGADGKWSLAKNMGPQFNNEHPNFINAITSPTPDGKTVILILGNKYLDNGKMLAGVSVSNNVNGNWTKPKALNITNDYNFNEKANYFLTNNRKALIMSVEREDSRGGRDLYVSFMADDSVWTEPKNLGDMLNTAGDETAPFLASDDQTMYFSSNGYSGYGGSDVYMTKRLDDTYTNWSEPKNMGSDINSKGEDLFFNIPSTSEYAYYSRGVADNTDIYRARLPFYNSPLPYVIVKGKLIDAKTGQPIGAKIIYERLSDGKEMGIAQSNPVTGEYEIRLPGGELYGVRAEADGHISVNQNLDLRNFKSDGQVAHQDMSIAPIEVARIEPKVTIPLNNIFFDIDKFVLKSESFPELNRVVELLEEQTSIKVEISGHADNTGTDAHNIILSKNRAQKVTDYLVQKGIAKERITTTSYGESRPAATNDTKEGRQKNRRVEFTILTM
ncbi:MAG TPA: OmpA family protein [Cyclobacteriaceae bacterium]|nr:OmpA family protein [Cyclobacteriaceae bacterium]